MSLLLHPAARYNERGRGVRPTLLLVSVIHPDLEDGRPLVAEQRDRLGGLVQLVDAAAAVLVPEEELFVVAQAEGVVQLLALIHHLWKREGERAPLSL